MWKERCELKSLNHLLVAGNFQQAKRGERDVDRDRFGPGLLIQGECQGYFTCMLVEKKLQSYACVVLHFVCLFSLKWFA